MKFNCSPILRSFVVAMGLVAIIPLARSEQVDTKGVDDSYTQAVAAYVDAASKETAAVNEEVLANEQIGKKEKYAAVKAGASKCDELVKRLRSAGPGRFDVRKSEYEKSRADLLEKLAEARKP